MKYIFLILSLISFSISSQTNPLDGYSGVYVQSISYSVSNPTLLDEYNLKGEILKIFKKKGIITLSTEAELDKLKTQDLCKIAFIDAVYNPVKVGYWTEVEVYIEATNCNGERIFYDSNRSGNDISSKARDTRVAAGKILSRFLKSYKYNPKYNVVASNRIDPLDVSDSMSSLDIKSEKSIRSYFDDNGAELIEGIWEYAGDSNTYRLAILKDDYKFKGTIIEGSGRWRPGDTKVTLETAASDEVLTIKWTMGDKRTVQRSVGTVKNNALIEFTLPSGKVLLYKVYPKLEKSTTKKKTRSGEWAGNGSGIIISKSGYVVTNHHVIEDASKVEVEFLLNNEIQKFNAEIVQVDKTNDLAIIKIFDMNFDGVDEPPYNFKARTSDVGTKVYAFGYPMALSIMGKEIKVTDGIISSKTGFEGDITTYQITAPIQAGNSGGPLFDNSGNLIGINSSGIRKDVADNVAYSIKTNYVLNLIDILPKSIDLPASDELKNLPLTEQIKKISKYVVLIKVK